MEFLNMLIDPLKFRLTCFLCLKQKEENLSVTQKLFICDEYQSVETTLAGVMNFLFPCHDIISSQACEDCSNILITTYTKLRGHNILRKTLSSITGALTDENVPARS
ncbi:uncharacterized protein LOC114357133 isoform X2 [Ostrinia furnacalis]|uniref:uncharacterized protein LOC114357133 isoform X2 n=1 Tax=Ostrinia furnacalis TaxID=93504 RepID=UPI001038991C|nr:uncharacterized protein LOC114357133 isoform X2 [Ostrinia furnacalis]